MKNRFEAYINKNQKELTLHTSNFIRSRYITALIAILELCMLCFFAFQYNIFPAQYRGIYLFMYLFLFIFSSFCFCILHFNKRLADKPKSINVFVVVLAEIYLLWGACISIFDTLLFNQMIVFVTNLMFCSAAFILKPKTFIKIILPPLCLVFVAFPFVQESISLLIGNYVNLLILVVSAILNNYLQYSLFKEQDAQKEKLKKLSEYDELSNLHNRRSLNKFIEECHLSATKTNIGAIMVDIDYFKKYNDLYGHIAGDLVIQKVSKIANDFACEQDGFAARYGGEEFIIIFENITHDVISVIAESIVKEVGDENIEHNSSLCGDRITVSVGVGYSALPSNNPWDLIKYADEALFKAKNNGRNQISEICI